jgi:hypothetical protein
MQSYVRTYACSVQVQHHVARRGVGEQGRLQELHRVAQGARTGVPHGLRRGHAAQGHALLHLRHAGPLQRRHEARRHRLLIRRTSACVQQLHHLDRSGLLRVGSSYSVRGSEARV